MKHTTQIKFAEISIAAIKYRDNKVESITLDLELFEKDGSSKKVKSVLYGSGGEILTLYTDISIDEEIAQFAKNVGLANGK